MLSLLATQASLCDLGEVWSQAPGSPEVPMRGAMVEREGGLLAVWFLEKLLEV